MGAGLHAIGKHDEHQPGGVYIHLIRIEEIIDFSVYLDYLRRKTPAKQIGQMDGVIHYRAASGQFVIGKPSAVTFWNFAVINAVHAKNIPQFTLLDHGAHRLSRRRKAHRERGHKPHAVFRADRLHRLGIGQVSFNWLLTKDLDLGFSGHLRQFAMASVLGTDDCSIEPGGQQVPVLRKPAKPIFFGKGTALIGVLMRETYQLHARNGSQISLITLSVEVRETQNSDSSGHTLLEQYRFAGRQ